MARNISRNEVHQSEENEFEDLLNSARCPPLRSPLNSIPDPSQLQKGVHGPNIDFGEKFEASRAQQNRSRRISHHSTPRVSNRYGKFHSEPNSTQSTPARNGHRVSLGGGSISGARVSQSIGGREMSSSSAISRGTSGAETTEVPHFELNEDPSFWNDHNVQALIRIRPLSTLERVSQGYDRCLKQETPHTLVWLGHPETRFTFDHVACETISQEKLFRVAGLPMVENCLSGYNSCMFAYGQTGSGKTYTMMGEISEAEGKLNQDCGITPRIFKYLFSRIKTEEESRRDEKLKFSCKCSFLEIYNEQIADLLEPSSTNLQLREDLVKGVYVENLTEHNVRTVNDVLKLLVQGAANRKIAATHMNSESSRSHSVFTCIIESQWEKDSLTHFRFARLNLVDLAGSERQKSSGTEGDRLKEAANINKSLSTLGFVIMSLVDLANGKHRHVPYRDSRLTFLLQDSLGGNSKTMIVANVSPSLCSANETLSTLKFAQRAKLIQNDAKVNEDASGDITALQREIKELKGQLSSLMKNQRFSASDSPRKAIMQESRSNGYSGTSEVSEERINDPNNCQTLSSLTKKMESIEKILASSLRREKTAEAAIKKLEAEIEHISRLASQREEDVQCFKMMLRFREEKIKQLEVLVCSVPDQTYPMEENKVLKEEIQLLQERIDKNPEVTRFALENIRLHEQLQLYQNLYDQGEREILFGEIADLRDQLLDFLEGEGRLSSRCFPKDTKMEKELENCRNMNAGLIRELDELRREVGNHFSNNPTTSDSGTDSSSKESKLFRSDFGDEMASSEDDLKENKNATKAKVTSINHNDDIRKELMDSNSLIEAMEAEQAQLINELRLVKEENQKYREILCSKDKVETQFFHKLQGKESSNLGFRKSGSAVETDAPIDTEALQTKLQKLCKDLTEAKVPDCLYKEDCLPQSSKECDIELVREEVETETARTILYLQEELTALQSEFQTSMCNMNLENERLKGIITAKDAEIRAVNRDWEKATLELTSFIVDSSKSLKDASRQIQSIVCSFPHVNSWISDYVEKAAKVCIEKEETVLLLQKSLEDAQVLIVDMELKLNSLKGAIVALNQLQWKENVATTEDDFQLRVQKDENLANIQENGLKPKNDHCVVAEKHAKAEVTVTKWLYDLHKASERDYTDTTTRTSNPVKPIGGGANILEKKADENILMESDINFAGDLRSLDVKECECNIQASVLDIQVLLAASEMDVLKAYSECNDLVQHVIREIYKLRCEFLSLKNDTVDIRYHKIELQPREAGKGLVFESQCQMLCQIKGELAESCNKLNSIRDAINFNQSVKSLLFKEEYLREAYETSDDYSISSSDSSTDSADLVNSLATSSRSGFHGRQAEQTLGMKSQGESAPISGHQKMNQNSEYVQTLALGLRKELDEVSTALNKMYVQLNSLLNENDLAISSHDEGNQVVLPLCLMKKRFGKDCKATDVAISAQIVDHTESFFNKFKNASVTMKEADLLLNELVEANESSKNLAGMWRQAGEELMVERTSMIEELERLRSSVAIYKGENQSLLNFVHSTFTEVAKSVSLLEENFLQFKGGVEETIKDLYSDFQSNGEEMLKFITSSVSSVEHMISQSMEQGFTLFVIHQCLIAKFPVQILDMDEQFNSLHFRFQEKGSWMDSNRDICLSVQDDLTLSEKGDLHVCNQTDRFTNLEREGVCKSHNCLLQENFSLRKELQRKEALLEGLFFDFKLLQESASNKKDIKDEFEKMIVVLCQFQRELDLKTTQVDDLLVQKRKLEICLDNVRQALSKSNSDLESAKQTIDSLIEQNAELRVLVKDLYLKKSVAEKGLEEQKEVVEGLEKEILSLTSSTEKQLLSSVKAIEENLRKITDERDQLAEEVYFLNVKLENSYALADEKEALAIEAHHESKESKIYAQQKEEEVKILEHSIEELECTINVLEKRVYDMDAEVERHRITRDSLEIELEDLRQRFLKVENLREKPDATNVVIGASGNQISRSQELYDVQNQLQMLERERAEQNKEIKRYKEYISEILLHTEAQASQYQEKYKTLEAMVREVKTEVSSSSISATTLPRPERSSSRPRGSSSPFRCIAGLVQQMDLEKDQELKVAMLRIEELGTLLDSKQKELCKLNTRLAASESMTHDVIRELLGVKLDLTSYANLIDQYQVQRLVEDAYQHSEEIHSKEQEIINLKRQISDISQEKEDCISYIHKKEAEMLATQISLERQQERDQLLSAQNEMLKKDKTNLLMRLSELDQMVKSLFHPQTCERRGQQVPKSQENAPRKLIDIDYTKKLENAQKLLSHANNELAKYRRPSSSSSHTSTRAEEQSSETRYRRSKS